MSLRRLPLATSPATALAAGAALALAAAATLTCISVPADAALHKAAPRSGQSAETTTVRYGPFTIPAATESDHGRIFNRVAPNIPKPCDDCFITGFKPNLVYPDGRNANVNTGPMMHHAVLFNLWKGDVVCGGPQRVFATGNERVESVLPPGYGVKVGRGEQWNMVYDLMNHVPEKKTVYISFTFTHAPSSGSRLAPVTPIWMDAGGCFVSVYDAPEGVSEKTRRWRSSISGHLVHMRGHLHHGGRSVRTDNLTSGRLLCAIDAEEGGTPEFIDPHGHKEISAMPPCSGRPWGGIERGDLLQITSRYELKGHTHDNVMGIMVGWVAERKGS